MEAPNRVGDENNTVKLKDPPANYRSHIWKFFELRTVNINGTEITDKD